MTSSREGMLSPAALWLFGRGNTLANRLITFHPKFQLIQNNSLLPDAVVVDASNLMSFHPNSIAANAKQISCFLLLLVHTAIVKLAAYCSLTYIVKDLTVLICNDSQSNGTVVGGSGGGTRDLCITYKQNICISMEGKGKIDRLLYTNIVYILLMMASRVVMMALSFVKESVEGKCKRGR